MSNLRRKTFVKAPYDERLTIVTKAADPTEIRHLHPRFITRRFDESLHGGTTSSVCRRSFLIHDESCPPQ
jgi:hypothetical protein